MVSATNGLYWGFHNLQYRRHGLSRLYDKGFFSEDLGFILISCISRTPVSEGKFLSKKCGLCSNSRNLDDIWANLMISESVLVDIIGVYRNESLIYSS
jgi:hypothetical protein